MDGFVAAENAKQEKYKKHAANETQMACPMAVYTPEPG
jgi:hypothetical protein